MTIVVRGGCKKIPGMDIRKMVNSGKIIELKGWGWTLER